ncbi:hypothetical protein BDC45DRAFT_444844, partial [Circinella umbellata]
IISWHDKHSNQALSYLGYLLYSSTKQRDDYANTLLAKIKSGCNIHSQHNLSIRGHATVLNVLLTLSLWHVLCLIPFPKSFFTFLRSICFSFLNFNMFPKISYDTFRLPRHEGGLSVLNASIQQLSLQF